MKVAHLILAHKNPGQVETLLNRLGHPHFDFYIHIDKKTDIKDFLYLQKIPNVHFVKKRVKIFWGDYGTIAATINGYREILASAHYDYINVISGQDLPIKPAAALYDFLCAKNNTEFITCEDVFGAWDAGSRVSYYFFPSWQFAGRYKLQNFINALLPKRKFPLPFHLVGRANWFTLTHAAVLYILDFIAKNPAVARYFKYCWGGDEIMFPTILFNSGFKKNIQNNLVYVDWTEGNAHPKVLLAEDLERIKNSGKFFARKFDPEKDPVIIEKLGLLSVVDIKKPA